MVTSPTPRAERSQALARLVNRHHGRVADITQRLDTAGFSASVPPDWEALQRVPVRDKSDLPGLQREAPDFGGLAPAGLVPAAMFWSPGSLSEPLVSASVERLCGLLAQAGFRPGDRVANGFAYHFTPAGLLFHAALVRLGATVLPIGPQQTALAAEFMTGCGATGFVGTASHLKALMEGIDAVVLAQGRVRPALRLALAGAEPFGAPLRDEIERRWGIACRDFYGNAEAGIIAMECAERRGLHLHPDVLWELLDPVDRQRVEGTVGELVITLDADELPLLRLGTGDLVQVDPAACACGLHTPRLTVLGRTADSARVRAMLLHASQVRAFAQAAGLAACRVVLTRREGRDHIDVAWRSDRPDDVAQDTLARLFRDTCRLRADGFRADAGLALQDFALHDERRDTHP